MANKKDKTNLIVGWLLLAIGVISLFGLGDVILFVIALIGAYLLYKYYTGKK